MLAIIAVLSGAAVLKNQGQIMPGSMTVSCFNGKGFIQVKKIRQGTRDLLSNAVQSKFCEPIEVDSSDSMIGRPVNMVVKYVCSWEVHATGFLNQVRANSQGVLQGKFESTLASTISKSADEINKFLNSFSAESILNKKIVAIFKETVPDVKHDSRPDMESKLGAEVNEMQVNKASRTWPRLETEA